jgi:hypothetical protein
VSERLDKIVAALRSYRFRFRDEAELQAGIARVLEQEAIAFERERPLGRDRVDFFASGTAIEIKVDGSLAQVTRQMFRYSEHPDVLEVLLVTCRMLHDKMPAQMSDKDVRVVVVSSGAF